MYDCHSHTFFSDGSYSPAALLNLAKERGLAGLCITDHDTIGAYGSALPIAQELGIEMISGIEISAEHGKTSIHVLGFSFDLKHPKIISFCERQQQDRLNRNQQILERLAHYKMPISMAELIEQFPNASIGRPHIAHLMVAKGYVKSVKQVFDRFLGEKGRFYVPGCHVGVEEAIDIIHQANGFAVLAHPHYIRPTRIIDELINMPFDGVEAYYGHLTLKQAQPWLKIASQRNWLVTGGSDFHGTKKAFHGLGCSYTPAENFAVLRTRYKENTAQKQSLINLPT